MNTPTTVKEYTIEYTISWIGKVSYHLQRLSGLKGKQTFLVARVTANHFAANGVQLSKYAPAETAEMLLADMLTYLNH